MVLAFVRDGTRCRWLGGSRGRDPVPLLRVARAQGDRRRIARWRRGIHVLLRLQGRARDQVRTLSELVCHRIVLNRARSNLDCSTFVFTVKDACESMIADPKWAETMTEYGITNEAIETHVAKGRGFVEDWVIQHGYNLTEIQELIWPANGTEARYVPSLHITLLRSTCSLECHPSIHQRQLDLASVQLLADHGAAVDLRFHDDDPRARHRVHYGEGTTSVRLCALLIGRHPIDPR